MKTTSRIAFVLFSLIFFLSINLFGSEARRRISSNRKAETGIEDLKAEIKFGRDLAARILSNYKLIKDERLIKYINLVGKGVALYSGRSEIDFHFGIIDSQELNAFATPGGYVFITMGALKEIENEAQLAAVLGHEIGHIVKKHVVNELNIRGKDSSAMSGLAALVGGATNTLKVALTKALDQAVNILLKDGYNSESFQLFWIGQTIDELIPSEKSLKNFPFDVTHLSIPNIISSSKIQCENLSNFIRKQSMLQMEAI